MALIAKMLDLSFGCCRRMVGTGGKWWVLEMSGGHWSQVVHVGVKWSPVVVSGSIKHNNLHCRMALIANVAGVEWWAPGQMVYAGGKW